MPQWVRLCSVAETPAPGEVREAEAAGLPLCLANLDGELCALDNLCPHRGGPLGGGWIEGNAVVCPWHSWSFDLRSGAGLYPENESVRVYRVRVEGGEVLVAVDGLAGSDSFLPDGGSSPRE